MNDADKVFTTIMGPKGPLVRSALSILEIIPLEDFQEAVSKIGRVETVGPLIDPTAWVDGRRFDNAVKWRELLTRLVELKKAMKELGG